MRLILVRHGQTSANVERILDTALPGRALTKLGEDQARQVGRELNVEYPGIDRVWHSPALRAKQTAELIAEILGVPTQERSGVQEIAAGQWEEMNSQESLDGYFSAMVEMMRKVPGACVPGGEDYESFLARYQPVVRELLDDGDHESSDPDEAGRVLVSHGAAIRTFSCLATGVSPEYAAKSYVANCRFVVLRGVDQPFGSWTIERWGDNPLPI